MNKLNTGLDVGWIGFLKHDEEYWGNLKTLADLGYKAMEGGDELIEEGKDSIKRFNDLGLEILTISADIADLAAGNYKKYIDKAHALGSSMSTVFCSSVNASFFGKEPNYDEVMADYQTLERAAEQFEKEGIVLSYHNHYQDFLVEFNQVKAFDLMLMNTGKLKIELDVGWALNGGEEPAALINRIAPRLSAIHVKDYLKGEKRAEGGYSPVFTTAGNGLLDLPSILEAAQKADLAFAVVEQDELHNLSAMESLTASYLNLKETGYIK